MVAGVSLMISRTGMVVLVAGNLLLIYRLVAREEIELARTHGQTFHDYCSSVPRWFPSWRRRNLASIYTPSFKNGLIGELLLWIIALALAVYAATLDLRLFGLIFLLAFIPGAIRRYKRSIA